MSLPAYVIASWNFDGNVNDLYSVYNGVLVNSPTYTTSTYTGYGNSLNLTSSLNQSVVIATPFFNLSYTSFTIEIWIYPTTSLVGDKGILGQCQSSATADQCFFMILRNGRINAGFFLNDVSGNTALSLNTWYHVAFVYDYSAGTQTLYVQGVVDTATTGASPYQGQNGSITIGTTQINQPSNYFSGLIDRMTLKNRVTTAAQILQDASLVAYFSFDVSQSYDSGSLGLNATLSNTATIAGKVGQALKFNVSSAYLQAYGFLQLGQSNQPYSIAMWVNPTSIQGGSLLHISTNSLGTGWCIDIMGLTYTGQIVTSTYLSGNFPGIIGPFLTVGQWVHVAMTYSTTYGVQQYINGVLYAATGAISYTASNAINYINIGWNFNSCGTGAVSGGSFQGSVDEVQVYRRELSSSEVSSLANP
ncbi:unnamed protein product [Didymodactylos carnosus]|uniref:LamG-like jellyroll fold domain-containing protein n=1 Tax=Didymodactylos carnosus TaxID=1234261 RepID=A0A814I7F2_9BILA|nr:unnamed protein product [Didymodactylos carnosus]CAF3792026.1 unnamed protein product [Didymodactylos carnosus]